MNLRTWLEKREKRAASKAINKYIGMFETEFGVKAKGKSPSKRMKSLINKLAWKFRGQ